MLGPIAENGEIYDKFFTLQAFYFKKFFIFS